MKKTVPGILKFKAARQKITALTAYDAPTAQILDEAGIDLILVGDSVANVKLGYSNTLPLSAKELMHHLKAVVRAKPEALVVADMPFLSYQVSPEQAILEAGRYMKAGAQAVKIEGGVEIAKTLQRLVNAQIPTMGHVGLQPQAFNVMGGYKRQGETKAAAERILKEAKALQAAGAFALVLECIPDSLAQKISRSLAIPTIGIGSGPHCDGQILVVDDLVGLSASPPPFVQPYARLREDFLAATRRYVHDVRSGKFR